MTAPSPADVAALGRWPHRKWAGERRLKINKLGNQLAQLRPRSQAWIGCRAALIEQERELAKLEGRQWPPPGTIARSELETLIYHVAALPVEEADALIDAAFSGGPGLHRLRAAGWTSLRGPARRENAA